jgi:hypothetical protein
MVTSIWLTWWSACALDQRRDRLLQLLLHEPAHLQDTRADLLEILVEAARNVVTEICGLHGEAWPFQLLRQ